MTAPPQLLEQAASTLDGSDRLGRKHGARIAAWLSRGALEQVIDSMLAQHGLAKGRATTRTRIICLRSVLADEPELVAKIDLTWSRLSNACHHHAFELSPTVGEIRDLVQVVTDLFAHSCALAERQLSSRTR